MGDAKIRRGEDGTEKLGWMGIPCKVGLEAGSRGYKVWIWKRVMP